MANLLTAQEKEMLMKRTALGNTIACLKELITTDEMLDAKTSMAVLTAGQINTIEEFVNLLPEHLKKKYLIQGNTMKKHMEIGVLEWENKRALLTK